MRSDELQAPSEDMYIKAATQNAFIKGILFAKCFPANGRTLEEIFKTLNIQIPKANLEAKQLPIQTSPEKNINMLQITEVNASAQQPKEEEIPSQNVIVNETKAKSIAKSKRKDPKRKCSVAKNGTLAICRVIISILKVFVDDLFKSTHRMLLPDQKKYKHISDYLLNISHDSSLQTYKSQELEKLCIMFQHLSTIGRKNNVQKQPKLKIKALLIKSLAEEESFQGLTLEESNHFRELFYQHIVDIIKADSFDEKFRDLSGYAKTSKAGKSGLLFQRETDYTDNRVTETLVMYKEEILDPTKLRGLGLSGEYHPDMEWCRAKAAQNIHKKEILRILKSSSGVKKEVEDIGEVVIKKRKPNQF
jgi:hypothetical protein